MRQLTKIYFDETILAKVKEHAKARKMSVSSFVSSVVADYLVDNDPGGVDTDESEDRITIRLYGTEAAMLRTRAKKRGMFPTSYIRNCILLWNMRNVQFFDWETEQKVEEVFDKYVSDIEELGKRITEGMSKEEKKELLGDVLDNQERLINEYYDMMFKSHKAMTKLVSKLEDTIMREDFGDDWKEKHEASHWFPG